MYGVLITINGGETCYYLRESYGQHRLDNLVDLGRRTDHC